MKTRLLYAFPLFVFLGLCGCRDQAHDSETVLNRIAALEGSVRRLEGEAEARVVIQKRVSEIGDMVSRLGNQLASSEKARNQQMISIAESIITDGSAVREGMKEIELSLSELKSAVDLVEAELATKSSELATSEQIRELRALIKK